MIGGAKGIGIGIDFGIPNQYCRATNKPYIEKDVLDSLRVVASAYGKTNNYSDRAIVKNLVDPDNPFVISNAAYDKMSSYGGYEFAKFDNTLDWYNTEGNDSVEVVSRNGHSITLKRLTGPNFWYFQNSTFRGLISNVIPFKVNSNKNITVIWDVHGLSISEGKDKSVKVQELVLNPNEDNYTNLKTLNEEELAQIDISTNSLYYLLWFDLSTLAVDEEVTIEMLPLFEGAFVTDGIDDLITSTKTVQEMLGGSNEITVVSMIHQVKDLSNNVSFTNYIRGSANGYFRNIVNNYDKTGIYGYTSSDLMGLSVVNNILGDKNDYTSNGDNRDSIINGNFSVQGYSYNDGNNTGDFSSVAWYWTIIANKVLTTDQINQVIAYFNLDRTLKSDIYCNIAKQGITNENHAEFGDKLIDFSGNGRDIQLNNIAWKGDSGIGKYEVDFLDSSIWNSSNSTITSSKIDCENAISHIMLLYYSVGSKEYPDIPSFKVIKTGADIDYSYINETGSPKSVRIVDGVNILPASHNTLYSGSGRFCGFGNPGMGNSVTITQIPSHAGGLCLDGINDFGKVTGMPVYKDYTFIIDREIISIGDTNGIVASKSEDSTDVNKRGAFLFEYLGGPNNVSAWSFYKDNGKVANTDFTRGISYQSKYSYNGVELLAGTALDSDKLWLGTLRDKDSRFANVAIYSLMSFPYSMSEFLIERQLKKHKLGTLYPDMVEFRPIVKSNKWDIIEIWQGDKSLYRPTINDDKTGIYLKKDSTIGIYVKPYVGQKVSEIVYNGVSYTDLKLNSNGFYYITVPVTKSPQKIGITIEQDENYILFNPVINSNYKYISLDFFLNNYQKKINIGDYIPKDAYLRANLYLNNNVDEPAEFTFNGVNIDYKRSVVDDTAFNIGAIYNYDSPQEVNITIDEYIRYEDIVQPYPVLLRFNDENGNEVSWGGKFRVGSTITRIRNFSESNLLNGLYKVQNPKLNGNNLITPSHVVEKSMVFTCDSLYLLDNNEPKCILSPRLLSIPNSSYKILGYIPDISGHGNHGKINNSAYAEGSGVNEDGSYQFDGVDDFVTIPTLSKGGKQVLMKVNWQSIAGTAILYDQRTNGGFAIFNRDFDTNENKVPAYRARNIGGSTYIDGILNEYIYASQLKDITHNIVELCDPELNIGTLSPRIGYSYLNSNYSQMSLYDFMLFDEISTDDKIQELNEYVGVEAKVELPPYYWDAYGKTNSDAEKDTIQQRGIAVGDYDLINYNHAYEGMSGYNGYPIIISGTNRTYQDKASYVNVVGDDKNVINLTRISFNTAAIFSYVKQNGELTSYNKDIESFKIKVTGIDYSRFVIKYSYISEANATTKTTMTIASDSIYELPKSFASDGSLTSSDIWIGINFTKQSADIPDIIEDVNVTIEVLPEYENGLVYDGVEDFSDNKNVPIIDDFTVIAKRTWLEENISDKPFIIKGDTLYPDGNQNAFLFEYGKLSTYSFGQNNKYDESVVPSLISWATPTSYNGTTSLVRGSAIDTVGIDIAHATKMVLYKLILYPKTISLLEINFLKNLMEKDEIIDLTNPIFIQ